jgi:hypothetical protein
MNVTWALATETLPDYLPEAVVTKAIESALGYISQKCFHTRSFHTSPRTINGCFWL